jgi:hypothetical protein
VPLATAANFVILAGVGVSANGGPTTVSGGNLGESPGSTVTGFGGGGPGVLVGGSQFLGVGSAAGPAQTDLTTAYNIAAGKAISGTSPGDIGGTTVFPGVWFSGSTLGITGTVTLNGNGNPNSVFVFQIGSGLTANVGSSVALTNGANACNVFWQVGSSATLNGALFNGNVLALSSIDVGTGATVNGRLLARNAALTFAGGDTLTIANTLTDTSSHARVTNGVRR